MNRRGSSAIKADHAGGSLADEQIVLGVLDAVERDSAVTQRSVARELNIALGLANAYLKRCVNKGLVKVGQVPTRRYSYYLTPKGFSEKSRLTASYLSHSLTFFRSARSQCGELFTRAVARNQRRIVFVGAGDLAEIATLVAQDHPVEVVSTLVAIDDAQALTSAASALGQIDAVIVTALEQPREVFDAAVKVFGIERVHAPELLRIYRQPTSARANTEISP